MRARTPLALAIASVVALATLTGCAVSLPIPAPRGTVTTEERQIDAASAVVLKTGGDITIAQGEPSLVIHAGSEVMAELTSEVSNGVLVLDHQRKLIDLGPGAVRYELTLPSVERVEIDGAGDITSSVSGGDLTIVISGAGDVDFGDLDADLVDVSIRGAGDVTLGGETSELRVEVDGTGNVNAGDLSSARATVSVGGAGDVRVHATESLDATVTGAGTVRYSGSPPNVTSNVSGVGEIVEDD